MNSGAYSPQAGWVSPFGNLGIYRLLVSSPELIADFNVLHRLQLPRHPPYALIHLIIYLRTFLTKNKCARIFSPDITLESSNSKC